MQAQIIIKKLCLYVHFFCTHDNMSENRGTHMTACQKTEAHMWQHVRKQRHTHDSMSENRGAHMTACQKTEAHTWQHVRKQRRTCDSMSENRGAHMTACQKTEAHMTACQKTEAHIWQHVRGVQGAKLMFVNTHIKFVLTETFLSLIVYHLITWPFYKLIIWCLQASVVCRFGFVKALFSLSVICGYKRHILFLSVSICMVLKRCGLKWTCVFGHWLFNIKIIQLSMIGW